MSSAADRMSPLHYLGGPLGATVALAMASTVSVIGVLRLCRCHWSPDNPRAARRSTSWRPSRAGAVTAGTVAGVQNSTPAPSAS